MNLKRRIICYLLVSVSGEDQRQTSAVKISKYCTMRAKEKLEGNRSVGRNVIMIGAIANTTGDRDCCLAVSPKHVQSHGADFNGPE